MAKTNWYLYNLSENDQRKICDQYINLSNCSEYTYWNYDCIVFYEYKIQKEDEVVYFEKFDEYITFEKGYIHKLEFDYNLEEVYNLLKPYIRKEKLNKILNEKN